MTTSTRVQIKNRISNQWRENTKRNLKDYEIMNCRNIHV